MASGNVLRNRKRFVSERLATKEGEQILFGSLDGEAMVLDDWWEMDERARRDRLSSRMSRTPMTLIPTNRRIVFYQAKDFLLPDRLAEIPLKFLVDITFDVYREANRKGKTVVYALATFVADERSGYPSVMFRTEITDLYTFNAERRVILPGICRLAEVKLSDVTNYDEIASSGIQRWLVQSSQDIYEDMIEYGEAPDDASQVRLPDPDAPLYDAGTKGRGKRPRRERDGGNPRRQERRNRNVDQQYPDGQDWNNDQDWEGQSWEDDQDGYPQDDYRRRR